MNVFIYIITSLFSLSTDLFRSIASHQNFHAMIPNIHEITMPAPFYRVETVACVFGTVYNKKCVLFGVQNADDDKGPPCTKNTRDCPTQQNQLRKAVIGMSIAPLAARHIPTAETAIWSTIRRQTGAKARLPQNALVRAAQRFASGDSSSRS